MQNKRKLLIPAVLAAGVLTFAVGCTNQDFSPANGTTVSEASSVAPTVQAGSEKKASPAKINPLESDSALTSSEEAEESTASPDSGVDQAAFCGTTNSGVNLHSTPKGPTTGSLPKGADVDVIGKDGSWYEVEYQGKTGYIYGKYLTLDNGDNGLEANIEDFNSGNDDTDDGENGDAETEDDQTTDGDNQKSDEYGNDNSKSSKRTSGNNLLNEN